MAIPLPILSKQGKPRRELRGDPLQYGIALSLGKPLVGIIMFVCLLCRETSGIFNGTVAAQRLRFKIYPSLLSPHGGIYI